MRAYDLGAFGWDADLAATFVAAATVGSPNNVPARVARVDTGVVTALTTHGAVRASWGTRVLADAAKDPTAAPSTGDWVGLRRWPDERITVEIVLPRRTCLRRAVVSGRSEAQVLATNVDAVLVIVSLAVEPDLGRIERLLALGWESGSQPVVVLTKADLVTDAALVAQDVALAAPAVPVHIVSAVTGTGMTELMPYTSRGRTVVLIGPSGSGKSTLANALIGADRLTVGPTRQDGKGRHITVARELVPLPSGGVLIDTPGLRGVGLLELGGGLEKAFPEIEALASGCRFGDCTHVAEPGCAVLSAVEAGTVPARRLESWHKLRKEAHHMAVRTDARLRAAQGRNWKSIGRSVRSSGISRP